MAAPICDICRNPKRNPRFVTLRVTICQWCVSELTKPKNETPSGIISSIRTGFETKESRRIAILKSAANVELAEPVYPTTDLEESKRKAPYWVESSENFLVSLYRNVIDDQGRKEEIDEWVERQRNWILDKYNSEYDKYQKTLARKNSAQAEYPPLETTLSQRIEDYINSIFSSLDTSEQIKLPAFRLLNAYRKGLINGDKVILPRSSDDEYEDLKRFIKAQDGHACVICNKPATKTDLHVHHIIPLSCYGTNNHANLVTLCVTCHNKQHKAFDITAKKSENTRTGGIWKHRDEIFVAISVNTTGISSDDEIYEITASRFEKGYVKGNFHSYMYSEKFIRDDAKRQNHDSLMQKVIAADKPNKVLDRFLWFIDQYNLVFHDEERNLGAFRKYGKIYTDLKSRNITDTKKIASRRNFYLENDRILTLVHRLNIQIPSYYSKADDSIKIGLAFIGLSKIPKNVTPKAKSEKSNKRRTEKIKESESTPPPSP